MGLACGTLAPEIVSGGNRPERNRVPDLPAAINLRYLTGAPRNLDITMSLKRLLSSRHLLHSLAVFLAIAASPASGLAQELPGYVRRGLPGPGQAALKYLEGDWRVEKALYIALGTRERPAVSSGMIAHRRWIAGGRYLHDITEGTIAGEPYYRMGLLGYSNMDARYEWVTADGLNANLMIYRSDPMSGNQLSNTAAGLEITLSGIFTDQGLISEQNAGRSVKQRTVIRIQGEGRHEIDLYFTPAGGPEILIDHSVYIRIRQ
jgi:hypothetical protein